MTDRLEELFVDRAKKAGRSVEEEREASARDVPMKRFGDPAEFGAFVAFLASERASYLTGTAIPLDGGVSRGTF